MSACRFILSCLIALTTFMNCTRAGEKRPDIVFIIVDDLNDWLECLGGHPDAKWDATIRAYHASIAFCR